MSKITTTEKWEVFTDCTGQKWIACGPILIAKIIHTNKESDDQVKIMAAAPQLLAALTRIYKTQHDPSKSLANLNGEINNSLTVIEKAAL